MVTEALTPESNVQIVTWVEAISAFFTRYAETRGGPGFRVKNAQRRLRVLPFRRGLECIERFKCFAWRHLVGFERG